jgi:hypothetical protein
MLVETPNSVPTPSARIGSSSVSSIHDVSAVVVPAEEMAMVAANSTRPAWLVTVYEAGPKNVVEPPEVTRGMLTVTSRPSLRRE